MMTLTRHGVLYQIETEAHLFSWLRILNHSEARTITVTPSQTSALKALYGDDPSYQVPLIVSAAA